MEAENVWIIHHPDVTYDTFGAIPMIIRADDPRSVAEQINSRYRHGGGWAPFGQGKWTRNPETGELRYPGDPDVLPPLASLQVNGETVFLHDYALICVVQPDGSFSVCRLD